MHQKDYRLFIKCCWISFGGFIYYMLAAVVLIQLNFLWLFGGMPGLDDLENPVINEASEIYSADNVLLGKFYRENRSPVELSDISPYVTDALISTEDIRFFEHSGIDPKAFFSIFWYLIQGNQRGASTITQQLAKNLFKTRVDYNKGLLSNIPLINVIIIKVKEWTLAIRLERNYTKDEILNMYLNTVDFGSNSFGIKVAARTFFNTTPDSLNIQEAATLVGALKATTTYNPVLNPDNAMERRNVVLSLMVENSMLSEEMLDSLKSLPVVVKPGTESFSQNLAAYFKSTVGRYLAAWCKANGRDLYGDGFKIYTTIDSRIQQYAEEAVESHMKVVQKKFFEHWQGENPWRYENKKEIPEFLEDAIKKTDTYKALVKKYGERHDSVSIIMNTPVKMRIFSWEGEKDTILSPMDSLRYYKHFLHAGMMAMEPHTGEIKAWVGGINFKYFQYDHVKQGKRQAGSAFKPFVYTAAIANGYSPCHLLADVPITFTYEEEGKKKSWSPRNSDWIFTGDSMTLRQAMGRSVNSVAAHLMRKVGIGQVVRYARRMGISSPLNPVPSLCLGSSDVSVYELTGAYSTFVNSGVWVEPYFISRIEDRRGNIILEVVPRTRDALSEETAYVMLHMLKGSLEEKGGTCQNLFRYDIFRGNEIGAKTGTTSNHSDGWFLGLTKNMVTGVWIGGDDRSIHFRNSQLGEGSKIALPVFGIFMEKVYADTAMLVQKGYFKRPKNLSVNLNCPPRPEPFLPPEPEEDGFYHNIPRVD